MEVYEQQLFPELVPTNEPSLKVNGWYGNASVTPWDFVDAEARNSTKATLSSSPRTWLPWAREQTFQFHASYTSQLFSTSTVLILLPSIRWLRAYSFRFLLRDLVAALAIAAMAVPQSLAYTQVAQLPRIYGLYSCAVPAVVYSFFGTQTLALGPVLIVSQLVADTIDPLMPDGWTEPSLWYLEEPVSGRSNRTLSWAFLKPWEGRVDAPGPPGTAQCEELLRDLPDLPVSRLLQPENQACRPDIFAQLQARYNGYALLMTFLVGLLQLVLGSIRLDFLTHFLTPSILSGFINGSAVIIALSQVATLLGYASGRRSTLQDLIAGFVHGIANAQPIHAAVSVTWVLLLLVFKYAGKRHARLRPLRYMGPMFILILSMGLASIEQVRGPGQRFEFDDVVLRPRVHSDSAWRVAAHILPGAIATALVSLVGTVETETHRARDRNARCAAVPAQEYRALGIANIVGSFFHGFVVARSKARTEVGLQAGAASPLAGLFSGLMVAGVVFALAPIYGRVQKHALAAIVFSSAMGLLDVSYARRLWRVSKKDFCTWLLCYVVSVFAGLRFGLLTAVGTAVLWVVFEVAFPHTAVLGRIPGTTVYRNVQQYPNAKEVDQLLVIRIDAPLFFANIIYVRDCIAEYVNAAQGRAISKGLQKIEFVLLDLSPCTRMDATALLELRALWEELDYIDIVLALVNPNIDVMRALHISGVGELVGREFIFMRTHDAVRYCLAKLDYLREEERASSNLETMNAFVASVSISDRRPAPVDSG